MASVDKVKVGSTSYDISPSKDGTLNGFTSNDAASPTAWTAANAITTSDTNSTIFSKITTMIKNVRWLYSKLGTTDFSATGQSTVTGALSALQTGLNGKAASSHSHTTAQLPVSSSQTNSNSYIPTSALVYSMQQQITSLNDAITSGNIGTYELVRTSTYFTLYDNSSIRRAKIELQFPSTPIYWDKNGTSIGSILPCNPTNDIDLCTSGRETTSSGKEKVTVSPSGSLIGYGAYKNTDAYDGSNKDRSGFNGTYYWSY